MGYLHFQTEGEFEAALRRLSPAQRRGKAGARRHERRPLRQEVILRDENGWGPLRLESLDISPGGVFLASDLLFEQGSGFLLEFKSPTSGDTVRVWSRVARVALGAEESNGRRPGMAFEFLDMREDQWEELASFIRDRHPEGVSSRDTFYYRTH